MAAIDQIRDYVARTFGKSVGPDDSLLDSGLVDSTGIFELVSFLEDTFAVKVDDEEVTVAALLEEEARAETPRRSP